MGASEPNGSKALVSKAFRLEYEASMTQAKP